MQSGDGADEHLQQLPPVVVPHQVRLLVHHDLIECGIIERIGEPAADEDDRTTEPERTGAGEIVRYPELRAPACGTASLQPQWQPRFARRVERRGVPPQHPQHVTAADDAHEADERPQPSTSTRKGQRPTSAPRAAREPRRTRCRRAEAAARRHDRGASRPRAPAGSRGWRRGRPRESSGAWPRSLAAAHEARLR